MSKSKVERRSELAAAKDHFRRRPKMVLTWEEAAALWGITKPAFHNLAKKMDWPSPVEQNGNTLLFPAYKAVCAMLAYIDRHEKAARDHARQFQDLVRPAAPEAEDGPPPLTPQEQLRAYELRQKIIDEELMHGVLHKAVDCATVSDKVFSVISRTFGSKVSDTLDPNGEWPAEVRTAADEAGVALVLQCFGEMKHMLSPDTGADLHADKRDPGPKRSRAARSGAGPRRKTRKG
jgi:predicted DNA-binding transcriptional regulator AlpA